MKISVVTAVYNNVNEIAGAIESVLSQRGITVEPIVVDGGSSDGTCAVIERYRAHLGGYVSARDGGIYPALNRGLSMASGDYVGFLHSDDLFATPDALANLFNDPVRQDRPEAVWGDLQYVKKDSPDQVVRHWTSSAASPRRLAWGWMPPHPALYVRRDRFLELGGFNETMRIAADYDFILRLFRSNGTFRYVPGVVVKMRTGGASNRSLKAVLNKSAEDIAALRRADMPVLRAMLGKNVGKLHQFLTR